MERLIAIGGALLFVGPLLLNTTRPATGRPTQTTVAVRANHNIWRHPRVNSNPPGLGGPAVVAATFSRASGRVLSFPAVVGEVDYAWGPGGATGPDGRAVPGGSDFPAQGKTAGIRHLERVMFLVGVFRGPEPREAPARLVFSGVSGEAVTGDLRQFGRRPAPGVNQPFFIGDGREGSGGSELMRVPVPEDATSLELGFADGRFFRGEPGTYNDNSGQLVVAIDLR